jgi:hypothetical protein
VHGRSVRSIAFSLGLLSLALCAPAYGKGQGPVINVAVGSGPSTAGLGVVFTETAVCPKGTHIVGGGWLSGYNLVFESRRVGGNAWRVSSQNRTGQPGGQVTYAYCRKGAPKTSVVSQTAIAAGAGAGTAVAPRCPQGTTAVAGGFSTPPPVEPGLIGNVVTDSLRQGAARWRTATLSGRVGASVTGYAYCARRKKLRALTGSTAGVTGNQKAQTAISPSCGKRTAQMGGFSQVGATDFSAVYPVYTQSQRAHKEWHVAATSIGGGFLAVNATAYCG